MNYSDQWRVLSSRIRGLMEGGKLYAQYLAVRPSDSYRSGMRLGEEAKDILEALRAFGEQFDPMLPPSAKSALDDFLRSNSATLIAHITPEPPNALQEGVLAALVAFAAFETKLSFLLSDVQESLRSRAERAFSHLQRSIVVDEDFRAKWSMAFEKGEVACEKLGAVHLLLHGIWAFKVDALGARTDLVFEEPLSDLVAPARAADGLVLTEWKKAAEDNEAAQRFEEARRQAERYAQGPLAATELTTYRYAIVVSRQQVKRPEDVHKGEIVYRHVNIAVAPGSPSRA